VFTKSKISKYSIAVKKSYSKKRRGSVYVCTVQKRMGDCNHNQIIIIIYIIIYYKIRPLRAFSIVVTGNRNRTAIEPQSKFERLLSILANHKNAIEIGE